jgi:hypothetical protein
MRAVPVSDTELRHEYEDKRATIRQLATKYDVSYGTMRLILKRAGARLRSQGGRAQNPQGKVT